MSPAPCRRSRTHGRAACERPCNRSRQAKHVACRECRERGMAVRNGREFIEGLRQSPREIWVEGRRVADVTTDPVFARPVQSIADLYDLQVSPEHRDAMTYARGHRRTSGSSFLTPRTHADLVKRRQSMKVWADAMLRPGRPLAGLSQHRADGVRRGRRFLRPARRAVRRQRAQLLQLLPRPRPVLDPRHRQSADRPLQGLARAGGTNSRISAWSRRPRTA